MKYSNEIRKELILIKLFGYNYWLERSKANPVVKLLAAIRYKKLRKQ